MDQSQRPRYVSRFEHLALHPRLHHRVGFPIHYQRPPRTPTEGTFTEKDLLQLQEYQTPLSNNHLTTEGQARSQYNNQSTNTSTEEVYNQISTSHQREQTNNPITQPQPLPKREQPRNQGFTIGGLFQPQTSFLFPQTKILNRIGQMIAQVWKTRCLENKNSKKILGKTLVKDRE